MYRLLILLIASLALLACSREPQASVRPEQAIERGRSDAKALLSVAQQNDSHSLHGALLSVKSREWQIHNSEGDDNARAYIESFKEYVAGHNKQLADEIF